MTHVSDLHAEYVRAPRSFVATATPRLSWKTSDAPDAWRQEAALIRIRQGDTVQEFRHEGRSAVWVAWPFSSLEPYGPVEVSVAVIGGDGQSDFSEPITVERAPDLGDAMMIGSRERDSNVPQRFARDFVVSDVERAVLTVTSRGAYQVRIDGLCVGNEFLAPGWSAYDDRLLTQSHDVTEHLQRGREHRMVLDVAAGWYREAYGYFGRGSHIYTAPMGVAARLHVMHRDGSTWELLSDDSWTSVESPFRSAGIYAGESFDARVDAPDVHQPGGPIRAVASTHAQTLPPGLARPAFAPPVTRQDVLAPVSVDRRGDRCILDFGQNIAGHVRISVAGEAGTEIVLRHAEVLEDGELATRPLREARATDVYTVRGDSESPERWQPTFTYHGFRYVEVSGWPDTAPERGIQAVVCGTALHRTGHWESSHAQLNRLHENVVWSARGNFFSVPTDCTQRDERLGWTGDIAAFAPAGAYLFDISGFLASWLEDLSIEQAKQQGNTPLIIPAVLPPFPSPIAGWGDASTMVPSAVWNYFGDRDVLARQFTSMRAWVDCVRARADAEGTWTTGGQIGDHLDPTAPADRPTEAKAAPEVVASAYLAHSLDLVAAAAEHIGERDLAKQYGEFAAHAREGFMKTFVSPAGRMVSDAQTTYALALAFNLAPDTRTREAFGRRLSELVAENGFRVGTGFLGTPYLLEGLLETGHWEAASRLVRQQEMPSWLYPVSMGATTIWERWDSLLADGSLNPGEMVSFNHYALGAVASSLYSRVAGLRPGAPGWSEIDFEPSFLPGIDWVRAEVDTPYGVARAAWCRVASGVRVSVEIPPNAEGRIALPGQEKSPLASGRHEFTVPVASPSNAQPVDRASVDLATLVADEAALSTLTRHVEEASPSHAALLREHTRWRAGVSIDEALIFAPPEVSAAIDAAFAEINLHR